MRRLLLVGLFSVCLTLPTGSACAQGVGTQAPPAADAAVPDVGVPVIYRGQELVRFYRPLGLLSPADRAVLARDHVVEVVADESIAPSQIFMAPVDGGFEIRAADRVLMVLLDADAELLGLPATQYAGQVVGRLQQVVDTTRIEFTPRAIAVGFGRALGATAGFFVLFWLLVRGFRVLTRRAEWWAAAHRATSEPGSIGRVARARLADALVPALRTIRVLSAAILVLVWLELVLESLPWTAPSAVVVRRWAVAPLQFVWTGFLNFLPDALFLIVIGFVTRFVLRVTRWVFRNLEEGNFQLDGFPPEWAEPTYKMARVLVFALALVAAYPYIPGSSSPAFQGISIFLGLLVSLSSSSAISNIIAGTVLTYTRAFRVGDMVRINQTTGQITAKTLLVTNVRTVENVSVSIPNAVVLSTEILNYTKLASTGGLVLATEVTIGYDTPWRTVRDLLLEAAAKTDGVLADPAPLVRQKALNDFYVTYRLNASTNDPVHMVQICSDLHAAILDAFAAAGVEIMSPHYSAFRDGNALAVPGAPPAPDGQPGPHPVVPAPAADAGVGETG